MRNENISIQGQKNTTAFRDLAVIASIAMLALVLAIRFEAFETLGEWSEKHNAWQIDELFVVLLVLALAFAVFSLRRWRELRQEVAGRERAEDALQEQTRGLAKRVKELNCLYDISALVEKPGISLEETIQGVVELIPSAWQYPGITCARVILDDQAFQTKNFNESDWKQASDIVVDGERAGSVQVCYLEERPEEDEGPFLEEERSLIDVIAERLAQITERRRSEAALEQSFSLLQATLEATADGILVVDHGDQIVVLNQKFAEMWRIPEAVIASQDDDQALAHAMNQLADPDRFLARVKELYGQPEAEDFDVLELKDGRVFERYSQPQRINGKSVGRVWSFRDVTAHTRAESVLRQRAAQLALLNDIGGQIAAVLELDRVLERAARLVQESFGYYHVGLFTLDRERQELVMQTNAGSYTKLFHNHRLKVGQGMVGWAAQHGRTLLANDVSAEPQHINPMPDEERMATQSELSVPIRVGEEVIGVIDVQSPHLNAFDENDVMAIETLADQIAVANENARLYKAVQQELTERARVEKQLRRYADELAQANEEVKRFAYIVSHDLRAPLVNLKGFASELRFTLEDVQGTLNAALPHLEEEQRQEVAIALGEDVPEALDFIDAAVTRMDNFIGALLKLSRLGRRELHPEVVDMEALVRANLETLAHQLKERQVQVHVGPLPQVVADRTSMEQIVGNILGNAAKYMDPQRPGEIEVSAEHGKEEITFRVRDNGRGIAEEDMDKVFAPFRRAGKQDVPGEGMGLAYVQALVRRQGGRIWCESELGGGTTFAFTLANHNGKG